MEFSLVQIVRFTSEFADMAKSCSDRFKYIMRIISIIATTVGADIFQHNYKINAVTWFVVAAIHTYFACTFYTIYIGFVVNGDWKIVLESLSLAGSAAQGYAKLIYGIRRRTILYSMTKKLNDIYEEYEKDDEYLTILRYRIDVTKKILKLLLCCYIALTTILTFCPVVYGLIKGEKLLIMKFYLPGIDPETDAGHLIHNVVHAVLVFMGGFGNFAGDMVMFLLIVHLPLWKDILKFKFKKLYRVALRTRDSKETMPMLRDISIWHQNCNMYAQQIEEAFYVIIFVQVFTSVVGICCTIFSIVIGTWPAAYAYLIYSSSILYGYCGLGQLVDVSNDDIVDIIYGDCLWYELTVAQQKIVLLMLRKSQSPVTLTIGQIMPLNMSTALQLTKAIYSYMMMLLNFLEAEDL